MTHFFVMLFTTFSKDHRVKTMIPAFSYTDAQLLVDKINGSVPAIASSFSKDRRADVYVRLNWMGGSIAVPTYELAHIGVQIEATIKDMDRDTEEKATYVSAKKPNLPKHIQAWKDSNDGKQVDADMEF
jgi:hypothetical protein